MESTDALDVAEIKVVSTAGVDRQIAVELVQALQPYVPELNYQSQYQKSLTPVEPWIELILSVSIWKACFYVFAVSASAALGKQLGPRLGDAIPAVVSALKSAYLKAKEKVNNPRVAICIPNPSRYFSTRLILDIESEKSIDQLIWFVLTAEGIDRATSATREGEPCSSVRYVIISEDNFILYWPTIINSNTGFRTQSFDAQGHPINTPQDVTIGEFNKATRGSMRDEEVKL